MARDQDQFLNVVDRETAWRLWRDATRPCPLETVRVPLGEALGRVLANDVASERDVPGFDRSNMDGYAVRASDTFGAEEGEPRRLRILDEEIRPGFAPHHSLAAGTALPIATGGMLPRGADAVVMVEQTARRGADELLVFRPVSPGRNLSFAGSDIAKGEIALRRGMSLSSRETGVLAAIGAAEVEIVRPVRVAIVSTGDEIRAPGESLKAGQIHDVNAVLLADAVRELGGVPVPLGIIPDDSRLLEDAIQRGLSEDLIVFSGGTSKGEGDLSYRALSRYEPGILVHGVALKPGKPVCLGAIGETPVAVLPGFPTSAIFTFHEFVAPMIRLLSGRKAYDENDKENLQATMAARFNSEPGRTEYLLVNLVDGPSGTMAYPLGKGSGSVTTFSRADGFVTIPASQEYLEAGEALSVTPLGLGLKPADLVTIGSHCAGLDWLLSVLSQRGYAVKSLWVGSMGGLSAVGRDECDVAGIHLLDPITGQYNAPLLPPNVRLLPGYGRMQGLAFREDDQRFADVSLESCRALLKSAGLAMVNRNRGSGTRILIDELLDGAKPSGYAYETKSHNAVAAAIAQGRADWGVAIEPVVRSYGLGFVPIREERYDFAVPQARWDRPAVRALRDLMSQAEVRERLAAMGFATID